MWDLEGHHNRVRDGTERGEQEDRHLPDEVAEGHLVLQVIGIVVNAVVVVPVD